MDGIRDLLNPGWVSSAIGLVSLVAALIIYRASLVGARPVYQRQALRLIGPDERALPAEVEVRFKGQAVERLTKTYIVFWNSGKALLRGSDIVADDPLRADFSEGSRVLNVRIVKMTRTTNKFLAELVPGCPSQVVLTFDYLNHRDGAVIEILHTDSKRYPEIRGSIRGVPKGALDWGRILRGRRDQPFPIPLPFPFNPLRVFLLISLVVGLVSIGAGALLGDPTLSQLLETGEPTRLPRFRRSVIAIGAVYAGLPLLLLWLTRRRFPRSLNTQELEE